MRDWKDILRLIPFREQAGRARRRFLSRGSSIIGLAFLLMFGGIAGSSMRGDQDDGNSVSSRLDAFRQNAPIRFSLFDGWWNRGDEDEENAFELITDGVREEYLREIPYGDIIQEQARAYDVDPLLVAAVVEVESAFDISARSHRGAVGLMQLRPATGRWMGATNLLDPVQNIMAGTRYLKYLEERFDGDLDRQLAAYNAGETVVRRYGGVPPYPETIRYIRKVSRRYEQRNRELEKFNADRLERESRRGASE